MSHATTQRFFSAIPAMKFPFQLQIRLKYYSKQGHLLWWPTITWVKWSLANIRLKTIDHLEQPHSASTSTVLCSSFYRETVTYCITLNKSFGFFIKQVRKTPLLFTSFVLSHRLIPNHFSCSPLNTFKYREWEKRNVKMSAEMHHKTAKVENIVFSFYFDSLAS